MRVEFRVMACLGVMSNVCCFGEEEGTGWFWLRIVVVWKCCWSGRFIRCVGVERNPGAWEFGKRWRC